MLFYALCVVLCVVYDFFTSGSDVFLRNRVISVSSPGMASEQSPDSQIKAFERSVSSERLQCILRTGGGESACRWLER